MNNLLFIASIFITHTKGNVTMNSTTKQIIKKIAYEQWIKDTIDKLKNT